MMAATEERRRTSARRMLRKEDPGSSPARHLRRQLPAAGLLQPRIVRSPFAHARITTIDVSQAECAPGVVAAYTGDDLKDELRRACPASGPCPTTW